MDYYNEFDPKAAAWLRELIAQGHLPQGDVDERSIEDVVPGDLAGYRHCHWFAGIGGWAYALRLAGWPDDKPVWTGSCPCQPFSTAGKGSGFADERHLWPAWQHLIAQCRPAIVFGEQVTNAVAWVDLVQDDLEGMGYAFGAVSFPSAGVGTPHIRGRIYYCAADANCAGLERDDEQRLDAGAKEFVAWRSIARVHASRTWPAWLSESGAGAFADGVSARVVRMRGYGNAVVVQAAQAFIESYLETRNESLFSMRNR